MPIKRTLHRHFGFEARMALQIRKTSFRRGRGLLAALLAVALGLAAVELLSPERYVGGGTVGAEVSVRVVPRLAPSAEAIRRRVLTNENLREVAARLRGENSADVAASEVDDAAAFERWRRQLVVEILPTHDLERRRIRFVALASGRLDEAAALVETVAVQYADGLTAERWYGSIDRLRSAEAAAEATFDKLLDLLRNHRTVSTGPFGPTVAAAPTAPANLPVVNAAPLAASHGDLERELFRLVRQRADLLETLQPAHPQVVAIDARLNSLQLVGAGTHVRRLSGEAELDLTLPDFDAAQAAPVTDQPTVAPPLTTPPITAQSNAPPTAGFSPAVGDAVRQWQQSRNTVKACLDELLAPAAAEFPVVSTAVRGLQPWEQRAFWQISVATLGLLIGIVFALPHRGATTIQSVPANSAPSPVVTVDELIAGVTSVAVTTEVAVRESTVSSPPADVAFTAPPGEELLRTVEQAAAATGGPVLGVLVRRREPASTIA